MLPRRYRLPFRVKFDKVLFFSAHLFNAKIKPNSILHNRYAVLVGKKIDKRATVRNKIRRMIYAVLRELIDRAKNSLDHVGRGFDILFIMKKEALGRTKEDFYLDIEKILKRKNLLR